MSTKSSSTVTDSMNVADTPASRVQPGREIPDNPQSLAAASPARLPGTGYTISDSVNSGFTVGETSGVRSITVKSVDAKDVSADFGWKPGSHPGDTRSKPGDTAKDSLNQAANNGGPRNAVGQFKNSRNDKGGAFQQTVDPNEAGD